MKLNRHQFYALAAVATFAELTTLTLKDGSQDGDTGDIEVAWRPKKGKSDSKNAAENGWVYKKMDKDGHFKLMPPPAKAKAKPKKKPATKKRVKR